MLPLGVRTLLRLVSPPDDLPFVIDEFSQEFEERAATAGTATARRWCWMQLLRSILPLLGRRVLLTVGRTADSRAPWRGVGGDLRYAARMARRAPLVTASVVGAIAGGIAAATALASVMEGIFLQPLPFSHPSELVELGSSLPLFGSAPELNYLDANDVRARSRTLASLAQYDIGTGTARIRSDAAALSVLILSADEHLGAVLNLRPAMGRLLDRGDFASGSPAVVLLSHRFWTDHFGSDPGVIGRAIQLGPEPARIVGVLSPAADRFPVGGSDMWVPLTFPQDSFLNQRGSIALGALARLASGETRTAAQAELSSIASQLAVEHPETNRQRGFTVETLQDAMVGPVRPMMWLIGGAIAALLAVACANIANLLLAQGQSRAGEFALRAAIGADRGRLIRQLWIETLAVFATAGTCGVLLSVPLARLLIALYPGTLPLAADVRIDARVLVVAATVTIASALLAGLPRIRHAASPAIAPQLVTGARAATARTQRRTATILVGAQVALSMVLLFAGFALVRTFVNISAVTPGIDVSGVLSIRASIPEQARGDSRRMLDVQDALRDAAAALPGVTRAAHAMFIPFTPGSWGDGYRRVGTADRIGPDGRFAHFFMVSPEYFEVMRLPLLSGRALAAADDERAPQVVVVSHALARRAFPGRNAVGQRLDWNGSTWEIVGVAADTRHASLWDAPDEDVYVPRRQVPRGNTWLLLRTDRPADAVLLELQRRLQKIDARILLSDARPMRARMAETAAPERFRAVLTAVLAAIALALAVLGLHGVVAYSVARRTREIGIRLALGQRPFSVWRDVILDALRAVLLGLLPGAAGAWAVDRWLESLSLVHVDERMALLAVTAIFLVTAFVAAAAPAWRASRLDPVTALRV